MGMHVAQGPALWAIPPPRFHSTSDIVSTTQLCDSFQYLTTCTTTTTSTTTNVTCDCNMARRVSGLAEQVVALYTAALMERGRWALVPQYLCHLRDHLRGLLAHEALLALSTQLVAGSTRAEGGVLGTGGQGGAAGPLALLGGAGAQGVMVAAGLGGAAGAAGAAGFAQQQQQQLGPLDGEVDATCFEVRIQSCLRTVCNVIPCGPNCVACYTLCGAWTQRCMRVPFSAAMCTASTMCRCHACARACFSACLKARILQAAAPSFQSSS